MAHNESADCDGSVGPAPGVRERAAPPPPASSSSGSPSWRDADAVLAARNAVAEPARAQMMLEAFINAVERLEGVLDQETQMLGRNRPIALHDLNHRKSHGLLELSRAMAACRALDQQAFHVEAKAPLARLRAKLEGNLASLQVHLTAVAEIAAVIARVIQDHESDGTYAATRPARSGLG